MLQTLHILCFTNVIPFSALAVTIEMIRFFPESETHFSLVRFMNSMSENMNQKRRVFEFFIKGRYESLFHITACQVLVQSQWI